MENHYFLLLQEVVNDAFKKFSTIDHDLISANFQSKLQKEFSDDQLADLLIYSGYIPDLYDNDSSQETLFSKLVEVLVCEMGPSYGIFKSFY